jgi:hypothetical protein
VDNLVGAADELIDQMEIEETERLIELAKRYHVWLPQLPTSGADSQDWRYTKDKIRVLTPAGQEKVTDKIDAAKKARRETLLHWVSITSTPLALIFGILTVVLGIMTLRSSEHPTVNLPTVNLHPIVNVALTVPHGLAERGGGPVTQVPSAPTSKQRAAKNSAHEHAGFRAR